MFLQALGINQPVSLITPMLFDDIQTPERSGLALLRKRNWPYQWIWLRISAFIEADLGRSLVQILQEGINSWRASCNVPVLACPSCLWRCVSIVSPAFSHIRAWIDKGQGLARSIYGILSKIVSELASNVSRNDSVCHAFSWQTTEWRSVQLSLIWSLSSF